MVKLDIGCGPNPKEGYIGCDIIPFNENIKVFHAGREVWPFENDSVDEVHASHFLEHLTNLNEAWERTHFFNEAFRVLKKGGKLELIFPHWASNRYYGDPTHKEPFSEMGFYYLDVNWRKQQAPHSDIEFNKNGYSCDFSCTWGYSMRQDLLSRNQEYQQYAMSNFKEAINDIIATCIKK
jgi:SAM-dependent methyltransferase